MWVLVPLAAVLALFAAATGNWLVVAGACCMIIGSVVNGVALRRRGVDWHGPATYRELREQQAKTRTRR